MTVLLDLIDVCFHLANGAGSIIREVQRDREEHGIASLKASLKDEADPRTFLTVADKKSQDFIITGLRESFGNSLNIVGEEEEEEEEEAKGIKKTQASSSSKSTIEVAKDFAFQAWKTKVEQNLPEEYHLIKMEDLTVFIDPVDGTREFVEQRLHSCQTLIGISWRGRAIMGIMGLPFHDEKIGALTKVASQAKGLVICGIVGFSELFGLTLSTDRDKDTDIANLSFSRSHPEKEIVAAISEKIKEPELQRLSTLINAKQALRCGGCGNKVLRILTGQCDLTFFNMASSLWDSCATSALIHAVGGKVTTLCGFNIEHVAGISLVNSLGVLVTSPNFERFGSSHDELCKSIQETFCSVVAADGNGIDENCHQCKTDDILSSLLSPFGLDIPNKRCVQALDLCRGINGQLFTADFLSKAITGETGNVISYNAPESEAIRYKQSDACRIYLNGCDSLDTTSLFHKRVVLRELPYARFKAKTAPYKLLRDIQSLKVEISFLNSELLKKFSKASEVQTAIPYVVEERIYFDNPIDSRVSLLLFDFKTENGWKQFRYLELDQIKTTLQALAKMHAFFWLGRGADNNHDDGNDRSCLSSPLSRNDEKRQLAKSLWETASYWHLGQQPRNQIEQIIPNWNRLLKVFKKEFNELGLTQEQLSNFGLKLRACSITASKESHGISYSDSDDTAMMMKDDSLLKKYQTIIHGDGKSPNFFFKSKEDKNGQSVDQIGMIDFQWTGIGIGAVDCAYCIAACMSPTVKVGDCIDDCLRDYHQTLLQSFVDYNVASNLTKADEIIPFRVFEKQFQWAFLDLARVVISDHWKFITPEQFEERKNKFTFNAYNKSLRTALWFIKQTNDYLESIE